MGAHSLLSPSGAERWTKCPASAPATEHLPDVPSVWAEEGTRAHALMERCLKERRFPRGDEGDDDEMRMSVSDALRYVFDRVAAGYSVTAERKLPMGYGIGESGTIDVTLVDRGAAVPIEIVDLKYGKGVPVDVWHNLQLVAYLDAACIAEDLPMAAGVVTVIQPRIFDEPRSWSVSAAERVNIVSDMHNMALGIYALRQHPELWHVFMNPGTDQCRFCGLRGSCEAQRQFVAGRVLEDLAGVRMSELRGAEQLPTGLTMDAGTLSELLPRLEFLKSWASDVESAAVERIKKGEPIEGRKLVLSHGKRGWKADLDPQQTARTLAMLTGQAPDTFLGLAALGPVLDKLAGVVSQSRSMTKKEAKKVAEELLRALIDKVGGGTPQLVHASDKRPEVTAERLFKDVKV